MAFETSKNNSNRNDNRREADGYLNISIKLSNGSAISLGRTIRLYADNYKDAQMLQAHLEAEKAKLTDEKAQSFVVNMVGSVVPVVKGEDQEDLAFA